MYDKWFAAALFCAFIGCNGKPTPTPSPSPTVEPTPAPTPTPDLCPVFDLPVIDALPPGQLVGEVRAAQQQIGDVCGQDPEVSLCRLAEELRSMGRNAYFSVDAVWVQRSDGLWEEHHAVYYGTGCWLSNTWYGTFAEER